MSGQPVSGPPVTGRVRSEPAMVPRPLRVEPSAGPPLRLTPELRLTLGDERVRPAAEVLAAELGRLLGRTPPLDLAPGRDDEPATPTVELRLVEDRAVLVLDPGVEDARAAGAYRLDIGTRAVLSALTPDGLAHGVAALVQAVETDADGPHLRAMTVLDVPRFGWRGLSLDVARHFFDVAAVLVVVDLMASLRLNVLHLHLTDDQGWRVEVPTRPELTEVSGRTAVDGDRGGWYTPEDLARIVAHAAARGIAVVPEVDVPGHVNAALHACGELTPSGEPAAAYTGTDVGFSRLFADLPSTDPFLAEVFSAVAARTPGPYVHIGGDEVLEMDRDEYVRLVEAAAGHVRAAGKQVVAWQEAAHAQLPTGSVIQYWTHEQAPESVVAAVRAGARLLLSPGSRVYLDMKYDDASPLGLEWAGHIGLRDAYDWEPLDVVPGVPAAAVVGVEAAIWTETLRDLDDLTWMLLPRLAAVAEVAWSEPGRRDLDDFRERAEALATRWDGQGLRWNRAALGS